MSHVGVGPVWGWGNMWGWGLGGGALCGLGHCVEVAYHVGVGHNVFKGENYSEAPPLPPSLTSYVEQNRIPPSPGLMMEQQRLTSLQQAQLQGSLAGMALQPACVPAHVPRVAQPTKLSLRIR